MTIPTTSVEQVIPGQGAMAQPDQAPAGKAKRKRFRFVSSAKAVTGLVVLGIYVLFAIIGPWVAPYDPSAQSEDLLTGPSAQHWFGTTHLGQDIFSQILVGTRSVMIVGLLAGVLATVLSVLVGVTAGYLGGFWDEVLSAAVQCVPGHPRPGPDHHHGVHAERGRHHGGARHRLDVVVLGRPRAESPDPVAETPGLRRGVPGQR